MAAFKESLTGNMAANLTVVAYGSNAQEHACSVLRFVGPAQAAGIRLVWGTEWQNGALVRFRPEEVAGADIVAIQRDIPDHAQAYEQIMAEASAHEKPVVYDLDDWLLDVPEGNPHKEGYDKARFSILRAIVEADAVTASTPALCDQLRPFNSNTWLFPAYLDDRLWHLPAKPEARKCAPLVLGYVGGPTHVADTAMLAPVLAGLLERYGDKVALKAWGGTPPPPALAGHRNVEWLPLGMGYAEYASYYSQQQCDICIAPLLDNPFNRCKSPIKFLEHSALGVPGVYSRLAPYERVVKHGENGFLASAPEEWADCLAQLIDSPSLRFQIGQEAQRTVRQHWLLSEHAREWAEMYQAILALPPRSRRDSLPARIARQAQVWQHEQLARQEQPWQRLRAQASRFTGAEVDDIAGSTAWRLALWLWRLRLALAPRGSRRDRALRRLAFKVDRRP